MGDNTIRPSLETLMQQAAPEPNTELLDSVPLSDAPATTPEARQTVAIVDAALDSYDNNAVEPQVNSALASYDANHNGSTSGSAPTAGAVARSAARFSQPRPVTERPIDAPVTSDTPMARGGSGTPSVRTGTIQGHPVIVTSAGASAPSEGFVAVRSHGGQTLWARPNDRAALLRTPGPLTLD